MGIFGELADSGSSGCSGVVGAEQRKDGLFPECPGCVLLAGHICEDSIAVISRLALAELHIIR